MQWITGIVCMHFNYFDVINHINYHLNYIYNIHIVCTFGRMHRQHMPIMIVELKTSWMLQTYTCRMAIYMSNKILGFEMLDSFDSQRVLVHSLVFYSLVWSGNFRFLWLIPLFIFRVIIFQWLWLTMMALFFSIHYVISSLNTYNPIFSSLLLL